MKLIGLMIFYDESPTWLGATVASLSKCCSHVVAVDGAYFLYPQGKPHSGPDQATEVVSTALALGMGVTYHAPQEVWLGNEVEKRNYMLQLGMTVATPDDDWFLIVDADELVTHVPLDLHDQLAGTDANAATYQLIERMDWNATEKREQVARTVEMPPGRTPIRALIRAMPTLHIHGAHYSYATLDPDGNPNYIWSRDSTHPAIDTDLKVEHRREFRSKYRNANAKRYYDLRDDLGIETPHPLPV